MARYWVNVRDAHKDLPHDGRCVSVDGSLRDAEIYAFDVLCKSNRINHVILMRENQDYSLEIVKEYDV